MIKQLSISLTISPSHQFTELIPDWGDKVSGLFLEGKHPDNTSARLIPCSYIPTASVFPKQ